METNRSHDSVSAAEARSSLEMADRAEESMRRPVLPGWFFPAMALLVGLLLAAQMLDSEQRMTAVAAVLVVSLLLNGYAQKTSGVSWASHRLRGQLPFLAAVLAVVTVTAVAVALSELTWLWILGGVVAAAVVAVTGVLYRRRAA